jgi:serine/threonine protein kinase
LNLAIQISQAILFLHDENIFHGHLSPSNILINDQFHIKVADFGFIPLKKYWGIINGYINLNKYSAPECFREMKKVVQASSAKLDIYSLGMIFYEIFSGIIPFEV